MIQNGAAARIERLFPVLGDVPAPPRDSLHAQGALRTVPAGTTLFAPGNPCTGFPLVIEGTVRVGKSTPRGRAILLYRVEPGESRILSSGCLLGHSDYSASGVAETDVTHFHIPANLFQELLLASAPFRKFVFGMLGAFAAPLVWGAASFDGANTIQAAGAAVTALGILLSLAGLVSLGRNLTPFPRPLAHAHLRQSGVYGLAREESRRACGTRQSATR